MREKTLLSRKAQRLGWTQPVQNRYATGCYRFPSDGMESVKHGGTLDQTLCYGGMEVAQTAKRTTVAAIGIISLLLGAFLRFAARDIAWPNNFSYSGPRENTVWAIKEQAYVDSGLVLMIFGLGVVLVVLINWLWASSAEN